METSLERDSEERVGVFICHCGRNIAGTIDVKKVAEKVREHPAVVHSEDYEYMCSQPGQDLIEEAIKESKLTSIVVAACSPSLHQDTFRNLSERVGLNRYKCEIANIREQDSWVHENEKKATKKAIRLALSEVEKVLRNEELSPLQVGLVRKALVIGGGIAGIQAALDIADAGYEVLLVEKEPTIGGHMAQLAETFPTLDCASCILTPRMSEVASHPNIRLYTYSQVTDVDGYVGNFHVKINSQPRFIDPDACNLCSDCEDVCPVAVPSEFDERLSLRKAIHIPFPQAVPSTYTIDERNCLNPEGMSPSVCSKCKEACDPEAINFDQREEIIEEDVGVIIVATGYELYDPENIGAYGADEYPDVITSLQFERLLDPGGPTNGVPERPSDGEIPKEVAFIHCVGSRDEDHNEYCSRICCMYSSKHSLLFKEQFPEAETYNFYIDIRAGGKNYEQFIRRVQEEAGGNYIRGKVSRIFEQDGKVKIFGVDTLSGKRIEKTVDMAVLALSMVPPEGVEELASKLGIQYDEYGFFQEEHPKLRPVETSSSGIFLAGLAHGPKDIQTTVAQASGAASKALDLLSHKEISHLPTVAKIDRDVCSSCRLCLSSCPYDAISMVNEKAEVEEVVCEGCGACASICPSDAITLRNTTDEQISNMIEAITRRE